MNNQDGAKAETNKSFNNQGIGNYNCYSNADDRDSLRSSFKTIGSVGLQNEKRGLDHSFPVKLHYLLSETDKDGFLDVVSWQPHGRCFLVRDTQKFVDLILPNWFRQSKIASFQRQLNLYGFKRITRGHDKGAYYHSLFLRGRPDLADRIQRTKIKGTGTRKPACPEMEPDFYKMSFLPPLTGFPSAIDDNWKVALIRSGTGGFGAYNITTNGQYASSVECDMPTFATSGNVGRMMVKNPIRSTNGVLGSSYLNNCPFNESTVSSSALDLYNYVLRFTDTYIESKSSIRQRRLVMSSAK